MATKIFGSVNDDQIDFEGDVTGAYGFDGLCDYYTEYGVLIMCSDGTLLKAKYGTDGKAIWSIRPIEQGILFQRIEFCTNESVDPPSDIAFFADGLKWAYAASEWESVRDVATPYTKRREALDKARRFLSQSGVCEKDIPPFLAHTEALLALVRLHPEEGALDQCQELTRRFVESFDKLLVGLADAQGITVESCYRKPERMQ